MTDDSVSVRRQQEWVGAARTVRVTSSTGEQITLGPRSRGTLDMPDTTQACLVARSGLARARWHGEVTPQSRFVVGFRGIWSSIRHRSSLVVVEEESGRESDPGGWTEVATFLLLVVGSVMLLLALRGALVGSGVVMAASLAASLTSFVGAVLVTRNGDSQ